MQILLVILIVLILLLVFLLAYNRMIMKNELELANVVKKMIQMESEFYKLLNNGRFKKYPKIYENMKSVISLNSFISNNFNDWNKRMPIKRVGIRLVHENIYYKELLTEISNCRDNDIKKLVLHKDSLIGIIYKTRYPLRARLGKAKYVIIYFALSAILFILQNINKSTYKKKEIIEYKVISESKREHIIINLNGQAVTM